VIALSKDHATRKLSPVDRMIRDRMVGLRKRAYTPNRSQEAKPNLTPLLLSSRASQRKKFRRFCPNLIHVFQILGDNMPGAMINSSLPGETRRCRLIACYGKRMS